MPTAQPTLASNVVSIGGDEAWYARGYDAAHYVEPTVAQYTNLLTATVVPGFNLLLH